MPEERSFSISADKKSFRNPLANRADPILFITLLGVILIALIGIFVMGLGLGSAAASQTTFIVSLYPPAQWVGWVASNNLEGNYFGGSSLYAGYYNNVTYYGLVRFDLGEIAGAPLHSAALRLSGLNGEWLDGEGTWTIELLESDPGDLPSELSTFEEIQEAPALSAYSFTIQSSDLGPGRVNEFIFTDEQLALLEERAAQTGRATFRLTGPAEEENALFAWDSGYGLASRGARPELVVEVGPVAIPADGARFVGQSVPATMAVGEEYTVTLTLQNTGSSTWMPKGAFGYILGSQSPPDNKTWGSNSAALPGEVAPGQAVDIVFSVEAPSRPGSYDFQWQMVHSNVDWFGDRTEKVMVQVAAPAPTPTATSTPFAVPFVSPTPTSVPTPTPTPDWSKAPPEWKGRILFKSDRDGGKAMSEFRKRVGSDYRSILNQAGIYPGKSNWEVERDWEKFWFYVMDVDGSNLEQLTGPDLYIAALHRDTLDPSLQYQVFVSSPRRMETDKHSGKNYEISLRRLSDGYEWYITGGEAGPDYEPAYCQADPRYIAYTSEQSYSGDVFVVDLLSIAGPGLPMRTTQLTINPGDQDWVWDKHPSWSADCKQIVFHSNRTGRDQIWVMDFWSMDYPGQNLQMISNGKYNDLEPVWIK